MVGCEGCRRTDEVASLALSALSQKDYRAEVVRRLTTWTGADGALLHQHYPATAPYESGIYEQMDPHYARRCVEGWDPQYGHDMEPVVRASFERGGAAMDSRSLSDRSRLAFHSDILAPTGVRQGIFANIDLGGTLMALCFLNRSSRVKFSDATVELVSDLLPVVALGDRLQAKQRSQNDEVPIANLSPREREVAELLTLGYTNKEIGMALGSSVHTVRNQVASLFRKAGASTRAELVGIIRGRH